MAFCKYVYIQPGKHKDGDGTVEQQEGEWWRRGWGMRSWWRGAAWWRPHISNSGILILICRAAPAHQLSSQTSGHPPPSSCHCQQSLFKFSFSSQQYMGNEGWEEKEETCKRWLHGQSFKSFSTSTKINLQSFEDAYYVLKTGTLRKIQFGKIQIGKIHYGKIQGAPKKTIHSVL